MPVSQAVSKGLSAMTTILIEVPATCALMGLAFAGGWYARGRALQRQASR
jgi:hypothetical protein